MSWESALDVANATRFVRATIKRELRACVDKQAAMRLSAQHLADPVSEIETMTAFDLIAAGRRCGVAGAIGLLNATGVSANAKVGHPDRAEPGFLTPRQRGDLIAALSVDPVPVRRPVPRPVAVLKPVAVEPEPELEPEPEPEPVPEPAERGPSLSKWCPTCGEWALPMNNGTCGFCDTLIVEAA